MLLYKIVRVLYRRTQLRHRVESLIGFQVPRSASDMPIKARCDQLEVIASQKMSDSFHFIVVYVHRFISSIDGRVDEFCI